MRCIYQNNLWHSYSEKISLRIENGYLGLKILKYLEETKAMKHSVLFNEMSYVCTTNDNLYLKYAYTQTFTPSSKKIHLLIKTQYKYYKEFKILKNVNLIFKVYLSNT